VCKTKRTESIDTPPHSAWFGVVTTALPARDSHERPVFVAADRLQRVPTWPEVETGRSLRKSIRDIRLPIQPLKTL